MMLKGENLHPPASFLLDLFDCEIIIFIIRKVEDSALRHVD